MAGQRQFSVLLFGMGHAQLYIFPAMYDVVPNGWAGRQRIPGPDSGRHRRRLDAGARGGAAALAGPELAGDDAWAARRSHRGVVGLVGLSLSNPAPTESQTTRP